MEKQGVASAKLERRISDQCHYPFQILYTPANLGKIEVVATLSQITILFEIIRTIILHFNKNIQ